VLEGVGKREVEESPLGVSSIAVVEPALNRGKFAGGEGAVEVGHEIQVRRRTAAP